VTIRDNAGGNGGGLMNYNGTMQIINSTITGNVGYGGRTGGGIFNISSYGAAKIDIINSTISQNVADGPKGFKGRGDAIADAFSAPGSIRVKNSIIASPNGLGTDYYGDPSVITSLGHNIASDNSVNLAGFGDLVTANLALGPLQENGGLTSTVMPLAGSPALDAVDALDCDLPNGDPITEDQRRVSRPQGANCDIGAVEKHEGLSWWPGDGNTNDVLGPNKGTLYGGAGYADGVKGQAFDFDGVDDYFLSPSANLPTGNADRSMELWAKIDSAVTPEAIFAGYGAIGNFNEVYVLLGSDQGNTVSFSQWGASVYGPVLEIGRWHHVAVSTVGGSISLYLDGDLVAQGSLPIQTAAGTNVFMGQVLGAPWNDTRKFDGQLDEVKVYDRALTAAEIKARFVARQPEAMLQSLIARVRSLGLAANVTAALVKPPRQGWELLEDHDSANDGDVCQKLDDFETKVVSYTNAPLTVPQAHQLSGASNDIRIVLGCAGVTLGANAVAHWPGNGSAEDVAGPNEGVLENGASFAAGVKGQAFSFDGVDDQVRAASAGLPVASAERSLELWAKVETFAPEPYSTFFAGYGTPGLFNGVYEIGAMGDDDRRPYFSQWGDSVHGSAMTAGEWRHLIVTNVGDLVKLYENGVLVASKRMPIDTPPGALFFIGRFPDALPGDHLRIHGLVDEVKVYDRALSAIEAAAIYAAEAP
jgi:hypothetical protein